MRNFAGMPKWKEIISILVTAFALFAVVSGLSSLLKPGTAIPAAATAVPLMAATLDAEVKQGTSLFARNCAMCHGQDARGDEGPTLYGITKSDAQLSRTLKEGIKGEMPRFGSKLSDGDIASLIAFLHTLKG